LQGAPRAAPDLSHPRNFPYRCQIPVQHFGGVRFRLSQALWECAVIYARLQTFLAIAANRGGAWGIRFTTIDEGLGFRMRGQNMFQFTSDTMQTASKPRPSGTAPVAGGCHFRKSYPGTY
jgi:hypothetical protein